MNTKTTRTAAVVLFASVCAGFASAGVMQGLPYIVEETGAISVEFVSSSAGAKGSLYFLGEGAGSAIEYAPATDDAGLGQHLFSNKGTAAGFSVDLGVFETGAELHFAYLITQGVSVAPTGSVFRSDVSGDGAYFESVSLEDSRGALSRVGIEDIRNPTQADWDYNDVVFDIRATPAPAPGAAALAALAGVMAAPRRRR